METSDGCCEILIEIAFIFVVLLTNVNIWIYFKNSFCKNVFKPQFNIYKPDVKKNDNNKNIDIKNK